MNRCFIKLGSAALVGCAWWFFSFDSTLQAKDKPSDLPSDYAWPKAQRVSSETTIDVPERFKNAHEVRPGIQGGPLVVMSEKEAWWKVFHDPTLDSLEELALQGNQDLMRAIANIIDARAQARATAAGFFPQLSIPLQVSRQRTTGNGPITESRIVGDGFPLGGLGIGNVPNSFAGQALANTYSDFQGAIAASYELDVFGRIRHNYGEARANAQASEADRRAVALSLNAEVATAYFALRSIDSQIVVLKDTMELRKQALDIQKKRLDSGHASQLEVAQAEVELANTDADLAEAIRSRGAQENALAALCGKSASDFAVPAKPLTSANPPAVPGVVPSALLRQRPDIVQAERKVAAASEGIGAARAEFFPTFNLQGDYGTDTAYLDKALDGDSNTWSFGVSVNVPIFEGGRNAANLKAARAKRDASVAVYQQITLNAFKEVEDALIDLRQRAVQAEARSRAVVSAQKVFQYSRERYMEGAINYFDVIDSQRMLLVAQLSQVQTLNARYAATIDLIRSIGGAYPQVVDITKNVASPAR